MLIDIRTLIRQTGNTLDLNLAFPPEAFQLLRGELTIREPVTFVGQLRHSAGGSLDLTGTLKATIEGMCVNCLEPVPMQVEAEVHETFQPELEAEAADGPESSVGFDSDEVYRYAGHALDIEQALRDNLIPMLPERPVCREDCSGICPVCGVNRNNNPCDCLSEGKGKSSPFDELKKLL